MIRSAAKIPVSQNVNALLDAYVSTEAEQMRLAAFKTEEGGKQADGLCEVALELADEIRAIRDRSANADLLGARILVELMIRHGSKMEAGIDWSSEAETDGLPMLEILSGRLTGTVRREARRALATIGVEIPEFGDAVEG